MRLQYRLQVRHPPPRVTGRGWVATCVGTLRGEELGVPLRRVRHCPPLTPRPRGPIRNVRIIVAPRLSYVKCTGRLTTVKGILRDANWVSGTNWGARGAGRLARPLGEFLAAGCVVGRRGRWLRRGGRGLRGRVGRSARVSAWRRVGTGRAASGCWCRSRRRGSVQSGAAGAGSTLSTAQRRPRGVWWRVRTVRQPAGRTVGPGRCRGTGPGWAPLGWGSARRGTPVPGRGRRGVGVAAAQSRFGSTPSRCPRDETHG